MLNLRLLAIPQWLGANTLNTIYKATAILGFALFFTAAALADLRESHSIPRRPLAIPAGTPFPFLALVGRLS